jgi:hypothetical protein
MSVNIAVSKMEFYSLAEVLPQMLNHPVEAFHPVFTDTYKLIFRESCISSLIAEISSSGELYDAANIYSLSISKRRKSLGDRSGL